MRRLKISNVTVKPNHIATTKIKLTEGDKGDEMALSFSIKFDESNLTFLDMKLSGDNPAGANLGTNVNHLTEGLLGILIDCTGQYKDTEPRIDELVRIRFQTGSKTGKFPITFSPTPTPQAVATGPNGMLVECRYVGGSVKVKG